jgi:hypothetical protein
MEKLFITICMFRVDSDTFLMTDFMNFKIKLTQFLEVLIEIRCASAC